MPPLTNLTNAETKLYMIRKIDELTKVYRSVQKYAKAKLTEIELTDFQKYKTEKILREVNVVLRGLDLKARQWAKDSIPKAYELGFDEAGEALKRLGVVNAVDFGRIHTSQVNILIDSITIDLINANDIFRKNINQFIRRTQQNVIQDAEVSRLIAEGVVQGETRKAVSDSILESFRNRLVDEQFITINGRNYRPDKYAEMVARTRTREASSQATINTSLQYDVDLVQWSVHGDSCKYCQAMQGKIFSISGTNPDFPAIKDPVRIDDREFPNAIPPLHPHCGHVILPVTETAIRARGEYDSLSRFSRSIEKTKTFKQFQDAIR